MPPVLDPARSKVDGLAFLGLSLARKSDVGHPDSQTHQTAFDLNEVLDRDYEHIFSTNDDGWLVGGGEPAQSYKLTAKDSAHVEIMRIGTYEPKWGGVPQEQIVNVIRSGKILIPEMIVVPTAVVANGDKPPELEIRFDMVDSTNVDDLPVNWQLRFVHNQLFKYFQFPSRFCPGAFHSTIVRKAEFRSKADEKAYFAKCAKVVKKWRKAGPQPLLAQDRSGIEKVYYKPKSSTSLFGSCGVLESFVETVDDFLTPVPADAKSSGIYLFRDRNTISHYFAPNFRPDTPEKVKLVRDVLAECWDEQSLSWKTAGVTRPSSSRDTSMENSSVRQSSVKEAASQQDKANESQDGAVKAAVQHRKPDENQGSRQALGKSSKLGQVSFKRQGRSRTKAVRQQSAKNPKQHNGAKATKQQTAKALTKETAKTTPIKEMATKAPKHEEMAKAKKSGYEMFRIRRTPKGIVEEIPVTAE